jgi:hypothetical protein
MPKEESAEKGAGHFELASFVQENFEAGPIRQNVSGVRSSK